MYYNTSDINNILQYLQKKYIDSNEIYHIDKTLTVEGNIKRLHLRLVSSMIASQILNELKNELSKIERPSDNDYSLDVPTQCNDCFAKRYNGICDVCAFTGDLSESGFYDKYGIMENCPFLTQKQIDDLAYNFIQNRFDTLHQEIINDLDEELSAQIKADIEQRFEDIWGEKTD